ncbi:MAG: S8 family serine peptidase [Prevotella sp.]|nr:S8 family serine peptidase [Prevotella sp.]
MKRILSTLMIACCAVIAMHAQTRAFPQKMSRMVRRIAAEQRKSPTALMAPSRLSDASRQGRQRMLCAFVRITDDGPATLRRHGCRELARFDDIYIAAIPTTQLNSLSACANVLRIEARESCSALNDTSAIILNTPPIYAGQNLPQAFTGKGVVVGVEDIGFDLTHPTFYNNDLSEYRIKRFWDQLSTDTVGSNMFVGAEYVTQEELLAYQHSRDGFVMTHGTHTAGSAAGSGFDTPYRGIAWESDLCLISNAVSDDRQFIDSLDYDKYTSATDALGFKYAFDYADAVGKPCVVSFSEGSHQDWYGDDMLLYEVIDKMVGPGHIFVASAGNEGHLRTYLEKPVGMESKGTFIGYRKPYVYFTLRADKDFDLNIRIHDDSATVCRHIEMGKVIEQPDSMLADTFFIHNRQWSYLIAQYPSCYNDKEMAYEVYIQSPSRYLGLGQTADCQPVSLELYGTDAHVELFTNTGELKAMPHVEPTFEEGEHRYSIYTPGSAPSAICVGAAGYRTGIVNYKGEHRESNNGTNGERAYFSSIGPSYDERVKPDVMAPGTNVISSYSSFYFEKSGVLTHNYDIAHFDHNGRTYVWNADTGTSMATPLVAGTIALWLQANPMLTPDDVKEVLAHTCRHHDETLEYPNNEYGYGEIDAYAGLLYVLNMTGIEGLSTSQPRAMNFQLSDGWLRLLPQTMPTAPFTVTLYSTNGSRMMTRRFEPADDPAISLAALPRGVYAVQVDSRETQMKGSTLIRH